MGLSDVRIASLLKTGEYEVRLARQRAGIVPEFKMVDTCAGEFEAKTPYYYSAYEIRGLAGLEASPAGESGDTVTAVYEGAEVVGRFEKSRPSVVVLGGGPIRIGQGIEFDYCAVHAAWALEREGYMSIIINNNPETVSTDFNTAGKLYFEPLTFEHVMNVIEHEKPEGVLVGFGGQTAINLVETLDRAGVRILGTSPHAIDVTEDRGAFIGLLRDLGIPAIPGTSARTRSEALQAARLIGFPLVVRPSYVLGGRGMAIVQTENELLSYFDEASEEARGHGVLIDKYVLATEVEVDVVSDGVDCYIPAVMEHVERAGVHSGDSIAQIPPRTLSPLAMERILAYTEALCKALPVRGIANIQYVVDGDTVFCLEVNPRASRTVPFVTKVTGFPVIKVATGLSLGRSLRSYGIRPGYGPLPKLCAVKMPVFSWSKMLVDPVVGPEMKSTGEVMGVGEDLSQALFKAFVAQGIVRLLGGAGALLTLADRDKPAALEAARILASAGWRLYATKGTSRFLAENGIQAEPVLKLSETAAESEEGVRDILSIIASGEVQVVINTFTKGGREERDGYKIRALAVRRGIPVLTCPETAMALARAATAVSEPSVVAIQDAVPLGTM